MQSGILSVAYNSIGEKDDDYIADHLELSPLVKVKTKEFNREI